MTINKIALSSLAAAVLGTVAFAGNITSTSGKLGTEKLSLGDLNITTVTQTANVVYSPTAIPAGSLKNPIFKFTFANAKDIVAGGVEVYEVVDGNESNVTAANNILVANTPTVSGANNEVISFNAAEANTYVYNNKKYVIRDGNASLATTMQVTVVKDSTSSITLEGALYSGDSQALNDVATPTAIYTVANEYSAAMTTPFDARIDASKGFKQFFDQTIATGNTVTDSASVTVTRDATIAAGAGTLGLDVATVVYFADQNLTTSGTVANTVAAVNAAAPTVNDYNVTTTVASIAAGVSTINLTVDTIGEIAKTNFGIDAYVTSGATNFPLLTTSGSNAGSWSIYGYNAQIPNVSGLSTHDTTMKFTNRSGIDTNIYFTLIDPDGTAVSLNSVDNPTLATLAKNSTGTYKASALVALVTDTNFDATGSFSVEVSIPTTPDSVYGMASFKNTTLGQFKDLPVYNSSTMSY